MNSSPAKNAHANRGYIIAIFSAFLLSLTGILIRFLTTTYQLPALILAFWRALLVFITLGICLAIFKPGLLKFPSRHLPYIAIYGFILALFNSAWTLSVAINGAAVATVMVYCSAAFTALLAWIFLKESLGWGKLLAVMLSLGGCLLVSGALYAESWNANFLGLSTGILAGLLYAIYSLMGRSASQRGLNPWTTLVYIFGFDAFFLLLFNILPVSGIPGSSEGFTNLVWPGMDWIGWGVLFILAAVPTLFGFGTYMVSLTYLPSSVVNLLATLEPVFTATMAFIFFGEKLNLVQLGGAVLILGGVVVMRITEGLRKSSSVPVPASDQGRTL